MECDSKKFNKVKEQAIDLFLKALATVSIFYFLLSR